MSRLSLTVNAFGFSAVLAVALLGAQTAVAGLNLNLVHPITVPLFVEGAEAGDVLAVELVDVNPDKFGYTIIVPGFGCLRDLFTEPFLVRWDLTRKGATSPDLPGVKIKLDGFWEPSALRRDRIKPSRGKSVKV